MDFRVEDWQMNGFGGTLVMKRILVMLLTGAMLFGAAHAEHVMDYLYAESGGETAISYFMGDYESVRIPSVLHGLPVTSISANAFSGKTLMQEVYIPDTVVQIAEDAFANAPNVRMVVVSGSAAEQYAAAHGMKYLPVACMPDFSIIPAGGVNPFSGKEAVQMLQCLLVRAQLMDASGADGMYNAATQTAVENLQRYVGHLRGENAAANGMADEQTMVHIIWYPYSASVTDGVTPFSGSEKIRSMQEHLAAQGLLETVSGVYDLETVGAVQAFQRRVNDMLSGQTIGVTGLCDSQTQVYLEYMAGSVTPEPTVGPTAEPTATPAMTEVPMSEPTVTLKPTAIPTVPPRTIFPLTNERVVKYKNVLSSGDYHAAGLRSDGTVASVGYNESGQCDTTDWRDIEEVAAGNEHTAGLRRDGTVTAVGRGDEGQCDTTDWLDIEAIAAGGWHTVGLRSDGTVIAVGYNSKGQCDTSDWMDIVSITAGDGHTVGLRSDGTVIAVGNNGEGQCNTMDWTDIVAVEAGNWHTVGIKSDGTVVAVGYNSKGQCDTSDWTDIVSITAGYYHTAGLRSDGTVVAVGYNGAGQCATEDWTDIVLVTAGYNYTIGLKSDGTVVCTDPDFDISVIDIFEYQLKTKGGYMQ